LDQQEDKNNNTKRGGSEEVLFFFIFAFMSNTHIRIGRVDFSVQSLKGITLEDAKSKFTHISENIVTEAWTRVNPKTTKRRKRKRKTSSK
jgi:hypothetical protein